MGKIKNAKPSDIGAEKYFPNLEDSKDLESDNNDNIDSDSANQTKKLKKEIFLTEELKNQLKDLFKNDFDNSVKAQKEEIKKEGQEIKKDFLTIFGVFASFVTFLSMEVQVFKNKDNVFELIGISAISLSFVIFFALILNDITKERSKWGDFLKPTYIFNLLFLIIGTACLYVGGTSSLNRFNIIESQSKSHKVIISIQKLEIQALKNKIKLLDTTVNRINKTE